MERRDCGPFEQGGKPEVHVRRRRKQQFSTRQGRENAWLPPTERFPGRHQKAGGGHWNGGKKEKGGGAEEKKILPEGGKRGKSFYPLFSRSCTQTRNGKMVP